MHPIRLFKPTHSPYPPLSPSPLYPHHNILRPISTLQKSSPVSLVIGHNRSQSLFFGFSLSLSLQLYKNQSTFNAIQSTNQHIPSILSKRNIKLFFSSCRKIRSYHPPTFLCTVPPFPTHLCPASTRGTRLWIRYRIVCSTQFFHYSIQFIFCGVFLTSFFLWNSLSSV